MIGVLRDVYEYGAVERLYMGGYWRYTAVAFLAVLYYLGLLPSWGVFLVLLAGASAHHLLSRNGQESLARLDGAGGSQHREWAERGASEVQAASDPWVMAAPPEEERRPVVVVGAGAAGLAVSACMAARRIPHVVLEARVAVGGPWEDRYERLHLHTHKWHTHLPYVDFPRAFPLYPSRRQVIQYLRSYAEILGLPVRCSTPVEALRRDGDTWVVQPAGLAKPIRARHVCIATGLNDADRPHIPTFPGEETFEGEILHSRDFGAGARYAGRRVLVIGFGNSGMEISVDLVESRAQTVDVCVRRSGVQIMDRDAIPGWGISGMSVMLALGLHYLPLSVQEKLAALVDPKVGHLSRDEKRPVFLNVKHGMPPVLDVGCLPLMREGKIGVRPGVECVTATGVRFTNGEEYPYDVIVKATGWQKDGWKTLLPAEMKDAFDDPGWPTPDQASARKHSLSFIGFQDGYGAWREFGKQAWELASQLQREFK